MDVPLRHQGRTRAHADFLSGKTKFPRFKARHRDRRRFTVTDGLHLEAGRVRVAKYGWFRIAALGTFTSRLARAHAVVVVEDLAVANMLRNHHLAAAISDQGWGELRRQLEYKTLRHGGQMVVVDRLYPSTKTCSRCGTVKAKLPLSVRTYHCDICNLVLDRDVNAAVNLAAWGERHLVLCLVID